METGKLMNVATDGKGVRRLLLHQMYVTGSSSATVPKELKVLDQLPLFDVPRSLITINNDPKHIIKRLRNRLIGRGITASPYVFSLQ